MLKVDAASCRVEGKGEVAGVESVDAATDVETFASGWKANDCGADCDPGLRASWGGRKNVLLTHPLNGSVTYVITADKGED